MGICKSWNLNIWLICLICCSSLSSCNSNIYSRSKQLVAKIQAKLIGDKIGKFKADLNDLTSTIEELDGYVELEGHIFEFQTVVGTDNKFSAWIDEKSIDANGRTTIVASAKISGELSQDKRTIKSGNWEASLPDREGKKDKYKGTLDGSEVPQNIGLSSVSPTIMESPRKVKSVGCNWDSSAAYFEGAIVSYEGKTYTLLKDYLMASILLPESLWNPRLGVSSQIWKEGGTCGTPPDVSFETISCRKLPNGSAFVKISGTATVNGYGAAVVAWAETDGRMGASTNSYSYGIVDAGYVMNCPGWGKYDSDLKTGSNYSVCVRKKGQPETVAFSASYTLRPGIVEQVKFAVVSVGQLVVETPDSPIGVPGTIIKPLVSEVSMMPMTCQ